MAEDEILELNKTLKELFNNRHLKLDKVVLFGSYVSNSKNENSDIDLILVSHDFRQKELNERFKMVSGINRELVKKFKKPFDTIFYSDEEWLEGNSLLINEAKAKGQVLYSQTN